MIHRPEWRTAEGMRGPCAVAPASIKLWQSGLDATPETGLLRIPGALQGKACLNASVYHIITVYQVITFKYLSGPHSCAAETGGTHLHHHPPRCHPCRAMLLLLLPQRHPNFSPQKEGEAKISRRAPKSFGNKREPGSGSGPGRMRCPCADGTRLPAHCGLALTPLSSHDLSRRALNALF